MKILLSLKNNKNHWEQKLKCTCSVHLVRKVVQQLEVISALQASSCWKKSPFHPLANKIGAIYWSQSTLVLIQLQSWIKKRNPTSWHHNLGTRQLGPVAFCQILLDPFRHSTWRRSSNWNQQIRLQKMRRHGLYPHKIIQCICVGIY